MGCMAPSMNDGKLVRHVDANELIIMHWRIIYIWNSKILSNGDIKKIQFTFILFHSFYGHKCKIPPLL
jgi:hypothetical protein